MSWLLFYEEIDNHSTEINIYYVFDFYFPFLISFSFVGLQVDVHDIDTILGNMALKLTAEELNDLTPNIPADGE